MTVSNEEWAKLITGIEDLWEIHKHSLKQQDELILTLTSVSRKIRDDTKISETEARQQLELFRRVKAEATKVSQYLTTDDRELNIRFEYSFKLLNEIIRGLEAILRA